MFGNNYPTGVTMNDVSDSPEFAALDELTHDELWELASEKQQETIRDNFLDKKRDAITSWCEECDDHNVAGLGRCLLAAWREVRNGELDRLMQNGELRVQ